MRQKEKKIKKKHKSRKFIILISLFLLLCLGLGGMYMYYAMVVRGQEEPETTLTETNTDAILHETMDDQKKALRLYGEFFHDIYDNPQNGIEGQGFVIPGLKATKTLSYKDKTKIDICSSMTPQGLAVTPDYILISAYCHTKEHQSVIYVIDKETHEFIKEVVLQGVPHAGGMAYDPINQFVWVACRDKSYAGIAAIAIDMIEDYDLDTQSKSVEYVFKYPLYTIDRSSFLTYYDSCLYVGYFNSKGDSTMQKFRINDEGAIWQERNDDTKAISGTDDAIASVIEKADISKNIQGVAISTDHLLLTQSYGILNSKLYVFQNEAGKTSFYDEDAINKITLPRQLEQIYIDGDDLYMLFESGAYAYNAVPLPSVDYVLKLDLNRVLQVDQSDS